jgi:hypothetical protein
MGEEWLTAVATKVAENGIQQKKQPKKGSKRFKSWVWLILWLTLCGVDGPLMIALLPMPKPLTGTNSSF